MGGAGKKADQGALVEGRRDHCDVVQMAGAFPRIIGDVDVALVDVLTPDPADEITIFCRPWRRKSGINDVFGG